MGRRKRIGWGEGRRDERKNKSGRREREKEEVGEEVGTGRTARMRRERGRKKAKEIRDKGGRRW